MAVTKHKWRLGEALIMIKHQNRCQLRAVRNQKSSQSGIILPEAENLEAKISQCLYGFKWDLREIGKTANQVQILPLAAA